MGKGLYDLEFLADAMRASKASRLTLFLAWLFGRRTVTEDNGTRLVSYYWRGKFYFVHYLYQQLAPTERK